MDFNNIILKPFNPIIPHNKDGINLMKDKKLIEGYFEAIKPYIYTDMRYLNTTKEDAFRSRLHVLLSRNLYRSLFLYKGCVDALNDSNFPIYHSNLKSFMEVMGLLGFVLYILKKEYDYSVLSEKIEKLTLGNKPAGELSVGFVEAYNVLTFFQKTDAMLEKQNPTLPKHMLESVYGNVCNYGHINFNAHSSIIYIDAPTGRLSLRTEFKEYKEIEYMNYMLGLVLSIQYIEAFMKEILANEKVNAFIGLEGTPLYD